MAVNRDRSKPGSVVPKLIAGVFVLGLLMGVVYWKLDSNCKALDRDLTKLQEEYARLDIIHKHEDRRWKEMYENPEKLELALKDKGLAMGFPTPEQIVCIDAKGNPLPNQPSMVRFRKIVAGNIVIAK